MGHPLPTPLSSASETRGAGVRGASHPGQQCRLLRLNDPQRCVSNLNFWGGAGCAWLIRSEVAYFSRGKEGVCEERKERLQREGVTRSSVVQARGERCQGPAKVTPRPPVRALAKGGCTSLTSLAGAGAGGERLGGIQLIANVQGDKPKSPANFDICVTGAKAQREAPGALAP